MSNQLQQLLAAHWLLSPREPKTRCLFVACAVKRRRFPVGAKSHPATAPAGSNRSSYGGNEVAEAFG